jgi:hypothetical protein
MASASGAIQSSRKGSIASRSLSSGARSRDPLACHDDKHNPALAQGKSGYRLVSRQPAASASSTEQNQRVPLLICILICAYQRLVGR